MSLKKIKIDEVEYEAEAKVIETLSQARSKIDELEKTIEDLKKDKQTIEADMKMLLAEEALDAR